MELGSVTLKRIGFFCFPIKHSTHTAWIHMSTSVTWSVQNKFRSCQMYAVHANSMCLALCMYAERFPCMGIADAEWLSIGLFNML
jgi:hypothetical protein